MKEIPLTKWKFAIVDDEDYQLISKFKWRYDPYTGHAIRECKRNGKPNRTSMHREILKVVKGQHIKHINGNKLDNRRENLETFAPYKGVTKRGKKYRAQITVNGVCMQLGTFDTAEEALQARSKCLREVANG